MVNTRELLQVAGMWEVHEWWKIRVDTSRMELRVSRPEVDHREHDRSIGTQLQLRRQWLPKLFLVGWELHTYTLV